ncbi:cyclin-dependent kinase-like 3 [Solea solea]|uniref:cyclin-dependent kinase-like 3 n=1 Tax=Solea solea TaxID=90069 RepID=UPI00272B63D4|nr:cyclin-dependent kinase-like 3 [Solea solea]
MERYESLGLVGQGSYGTVLKCRHRDSGQLVAIKKFMDSDDDKTVKKIALREIKLLRQLRHGNLVNLLEVWKRRRRWYLVFEFVERTLLDVLDQRESGLDLSTSRRFLYQILSAAAFCHQQNIIHRDIKPENVLISHGGVVKLCDFGFARTLASPAESDVYTDYVATRWYRAPELLVGDIKYGKPVDVWAIGCLVLEMLTGQPLFPGDSDLDQIHHIVRCFGNLTAHHQALFYRNPVFSGVKLPECCGQVQLHQRFPSISPVTMDLAQSCLQVDPERRAHCSDLLEHPLFTEDSFQIRFLNELNAKIQKDHRENSTLPKITKTPKHGRDNATVEEKKDKKEEEKVEKRKTKQPKPKLLKTVQNTPEMLGSTKQSKILGGKVADNAAREADNIKVTTGAGSSKKLKTCKSVKPLTSNSSHQGIKTVTGLKDKNTLTSKSRDGQAVKTVMGIDRSSTSKPSQEDVKNWNNRKLSKNSNTDHPNVSSYLESAVNQKDTRLALQTCSLPSNDRVEVTTSSTNPSATKPCKVSAFSEQQINEHLKVVPLNTRLSMTTSTNTSLSIGPSKTCISVLFIQTSPANSIMTLHKGISKPNLFNTGSPPKPTNDTTGAPNKPSDAVAEYPEPAIEGSPETKVSPETTKIISHISVPSTSGRDHKEHLESSEPFSVHQENAYKFRINPESRSPSDPTLNEIPKTNLPVETAIPKIWKFSDKENTEDSTVSVSIYATNKSPVSQIFGSSSDKNKSNGVKSDMKPTSATAIQKKSSLFPAEAAEKKSDMCTSTATDSTLHGTPDHESSKRIFICQNMDSADVSNVDAIIPNFTSNPPPAPCSTPVLLPPSSFSVGSTNIPTIDDHSDVRFPPRNHGLRCKDWKRHYSGIRKRVTKPSQSNYVTTKVSDKSRTGGRFFQCDCCDDGNGVAVARKKSDVHFPDLSSSVPPQFRGRDGGNNSTYTGLTVGVLCCYGDAFDPHAFPDLPQ